MTPTLSKITKKDGQTWIVVKRISATDELDHYLQEIIRLTQELHDKAEHLDEVSRHTIEWRATDIQTEVQKIKEALTKESSSGFMTIHVKNAEITMAEQRGTNLVIEV